MSKDGHARGTGAEPVPEGKPNPLTGLNMHISGLGRNMYESL